MRWQAQVTTGHAGATDVQVADHAPGHRLVVGVEYIQAGIVDGGANRQCPLRQLGARLQRPGTAIDGGLGRPINVMQAHTRQALTHLGGQGFGQLAATADDIAEAGAAAAGGSFEELLQQRRHELHHADLLRLDQLREVLRVALAVRACQHQAQAAAQWPEQLPHRGIEADRGFVQHRAVTRRLAKALAPAHQVDHVAVLDHDPFGQARGAGGVDHISQMPSVQRRHAWVADRLGVPARLVEVDQGRLGAVRGLAGGAVHQHRQRRTVHQHVANAFGRVTRVDRHIGTARLEDGQQADHHRQTTLDADRHTVIGFYP
ncbi:hypothetical protein D3C76_246820 [compost metagenome]